MDMNLHYEIEQLIKKVSANRFFNEPLNTRGLREMIYENENKLKDFAEQQARKIDWSVYNSDDVKWFYKFKQIYRYTLQG